MDTSIDRGWIGRAMRRREDARLLVGQGRFVADLAPPGALVLEILRSPYPAGRIVMLDIGAAAEAPGVVLVLTGGDLSDLGAASVNPLLPGARVRPMQPLATGQVAALGQAVVAVVADTAAAARDALDLVELEVEEEPLEEQVAVQHARGGAAGAAPAIVVEARIDHARLAPLALEPRAALADWDGRRLTCHLSTQTPHRCRDDLAAMLHLDPAAVRVVAPDVGGAFGGKASLMPEDVLCAVAAMRLGRPVRWTATRSDEFQAATQGRGATTTGRLALDGDGRILSVEAQMRFPLGHWMPYSALAPVSNGSRILPGPYAAGAVRTEVAAVLGDGAAVNIYRGAGRPEAAMLMERLIDRAAMARGEDPLACRRRNLRRPSDRPDAGGPCSGNYPALLDHLERASDYATRRRSVIARRTAGAHCGLGIALYVEPCGQGWEFAALRVGRDGRAVLHSGASTQGQGRETALAQVAADALGLVPGDVTVVTGDTDAVAEGIGALASRSTAIGASAVLAAAEALVEAVRAEAAVHLNTAPDAVAVGSGGLAAPHGARIGWGDLAARLGRDLTGTARYEAPAEAWAAGAVLAEVTIDPDTGAVGVEEIVWVDDAGTVVNPMLVEGQLIGGAAQGIGAALMERIVYLDGQLLTGSLMDYAVPRAADMPPIRLVKAPTPTPANRLGARGVGEAGCIGVPAAILNAVMDALPPGTPDLPLPLTPERVWRALNRMEP
ncbi:MAG: xanthine dehydrogenase family protein molybdopterin-binding subunit [Gemmobacter sp.]